MSPDSGRANRRILIVDDSASIHEDFRKILCADPNGEPSMDSLEETLFAGQVARVCLGWESATCGPAAIARSEFSARWQALRSHHHNSSRFGNGLVGVRVFECGGVCIY